MLRLGTQLAASELTAIHSLYRNQKALFESGHRLSTMKRINRGQDDPAGMIAVEKHARVSDRALIVEQSETAVGPANVAEQSRRRGAPFFV